MKNSLSLTLMPKRPKQRRKSMSSLAAGVPPRSPPLSPRPGTMLRFPTLDESVSVHRNSGLDIPNSETPDLLRKIRRSSHGDEPVATANATRRKPPRLLPSVLDPHSTYAYASLPSTPLPPPSPPASEPKPVYITAEPPPFSLWEYLREEVLATDFDSHQEMKWERVGNFLSVPVSVEKCIMFGFVLCLDSFLHNFTISPIRFVLALWRATINLFRRSRPPLPPSQKADIIRVLLLTLSLAILFPLLNASKMYHSIRGQDTIKLYVIFNALEIADRLLCSIGQDVLDCMFSRTTLTLMSHHIAPTPSTLRPLLFFVLSLMYIVSHATVLAYQLTSLNVAINSYDYSLLTLLLSNQFVEIKGSVFKRFEKDNLFQITCADIVERFQLSLILFSIAFRNLIELGTAGLDVNALPKAFRFSDGRSIVWSIFTPALTVLLSEVGVDWLKHAFITKFNHIRPTVYERYVDILCRDLCISQGNWVGRRSGFRKHAYVDQSPVVARRLGFASLPMAVLTIIIGTQSAAPLFASHSSPRVYYSGLSVALEGLRKHTKWFALGCLFWLCLVTVKLIIGVNLISYATRRRAGMDARMKEDDDLNDYGRGPIGEGKEEQKYNRELKTFLNHKRDSVPPVAEMGENIKPSLESAKAGATAKSGTGGGGRKRIPLEDLTRFTMVKRIW